MVGVVITEEDILQCQFLPTHRLGTKKNKKGLRKTDREYILFIFAVGSLALYALDGSSSVWGSRDTSVGTVGSSVTKNVTFVFQATVGTLPSMT